jgi:hypothetical protein
MNLEQTQIALFAAYDLRNAMTAADRRRPTENDSFGKSINAVIAFLELTESIYQDEKGEK